MNSAKIRRAFVSVALDSSAPGSRRHVTIYDNFGASLESFVSHHGAHASFRVVRAVWGPIAATCAAV
jgi:hypothetical protein